MNKKFPLQICQDEEITKKFRNLHTELVNKVISFCKENNIIVDDFHLNADGLAESILYGSWQSCTDSSFSLIKYSDEFKQVFWDCDKEKIDSMTKQDINNLEYEGKKTILLSM